MRRRDRTAPSSRVIISLLVCAAWAAAPAAAMACAGWRPHEHVPARMAQATPPAPPSTAAAVAPSGDSQRGSMHGSVPQQNP